MEKTQRNTLVLVLTPLIAIFVFVFPRVLIAWLGRDNPWTSYLYQYSFGLIFFSVGLLLIRKTGACNIERPRDRLWYRVLIAGFIFFASLHAIWIALSLYIPVKGG